MPEQEQINEMHQWFAVECNNIAWGLTTKDRTAVEDRQMLDLAHAASYHWDAVGTELHKMRALMLVAHVHAELGLGSTALAYAAECTTYFTARETDDWELAFTHMIHAQAAHASGDMKLHTKLYHKAEKIVNAMPEGEDKRIVYATWVRIPQAADEIK